MQEDIIIKHHNHHTKLSIHQKLIIFNNNPQHINIHNTSTPNQHQIQYKINRTLKKSLLNNKINNSQTYHLLTDPNYISQHRLTHQKHKIQIFPLPNSNTNQNKFHPSKKNHNQSISHRKLFPEEEDFLNQLKQKAKIKSSRNFTKSFINDNLVNNLTNLQKLSQKKLNDNLLNNISNKGNRSKTLNVQNSNESNNQSYRPSKKQKNYLLFKKNYQKQTSQNLNKFYEKFENFCKNSQRQKTTSYKDFDSFHRESSLHQDKLLKKQSFRQKIDCRILKLNQSKLEKRKKLRLQHQKVQEQKQKVNHKVQKRSYKRQIKQDNISCRNNSRIKILVKSNSNNKVFDHSQNKKSIIEKIQRSRQKQSNGSQNSNHQKTFQNNPGQQNKFFFSWKGQRIHQQKDSTSYLLKSQSNSQKKKNKYSPHQRSMKINNNMHIVVTENNKTKINIFHNSILLKQDPQKVDVLTSLVREASESSKPQKLSVPSELEINKLSILQKSSPNSVKNSQKQVNQYIKEIVKNLKNNRKSPIQKMKTQRKYHFKMQDVQPWEINDQKNIQDSKQLFNSSFYCNSKTIV